MSPALSPELTLAYLHELSPHVERSALFDGEDGWLAGDRSLAPLAAGGSASGAAPIVRRDGDWTLVALSGDATPRPLVEFDVGLAMAAVRGHC